MAGNAVIGALRVNLGLNSADFENGLKNVKQQFGAFGKMFAGLAAAGVFAGFSAGIGQAVGRIEEMRKLSSQLDRALVNTGNTAKTSASEVSGFADELERSTGRAAEEVMALSTNLATFGFSREVFFDAIELADDMAAAWGGDLKQNAEGLARALADPEKGLAMLTKRGITFTEEQKNMIAGFMKANDLIGAQGVVMDALNEQVKGVAAAGFSGLTKASANARLGLEEFFEGIANGLQLNLGLELGLVGVAGALRLVTDNLGVIGRAVAVAGTALVTAMGPAIWTAMSTAALAFGKTAVGAITAVGAAIARNPIGAIVVALSAAVSAAFLFRDEIKRAIGVDFVGIIGDAVNVIIGGFVGAFEAIKAVFSELPGAIGDLVYQGAQSALDAVVYLIRGVQLKVRGFLGWVNIQLAKVGRSLDLSDFKLMAYVEVENPFSGKAGEAGSAISDAFSDAQKDYLGALGGLFSGVGQSASGAAANIQGFGDILDETASGGGAGVDSLAKKVGGLNDAFSGVKDSMSELWGSMKTGLASMATGVTKAFFNTKDAAGAAIDAIVSGLDQIANKALDMLWNGVFDMLFGAFGGNSLGGGWGKAGGFAGFKGIFGIPGLATGGRLMAGGLVEVGERGKELVNLPAGAQVIRHSDIGNVGGGNTHVTFGVGADQNGNLLPFIERVFQDGLEVYRRTGLQHDIISTMDDPMARGNL